MTKYVIGNIKGPKGDKGEQGDQGERGIKGITGKTGNTGEKGPSFNIKKVYNNPSAVADDISNNIITTDDYFLVAIDGDEPDVSLYTVIEDNGIKTSKLLTKMSGTPGVKGEIGDQGPTGDQGLTGSVGERGTTGVGVSSVTKIGNTITVSYDNETTKEFSLNNGIKGSTGDPGEPGKQLTYYLDEDGNLTYTY